MTYSISVVYHPKTDNVTVTNAYKELVKWHPVSVRKFEYDDQAIAAIKNCFDPERCVLFTIGDLFLEHVKMDELEKRLPDIIFAWGPDDDLRDDLSDFLHFALFTQVDEVVFKDIIQLLNVPMLKSKETPTDYELFIEYDDKRDWMFFQVQRPFDEPPFTTVVKNYSKRGMEPLFAQLFISKGWGLLKSDVDFLEALWNSEFKETEFNLTRILEKHGEELVPSKNGLPLESPWLFRKSIDEIKNNVDFY